MLTEQLMLSPLVYLLAQGDVCSSFEEPPVLGDGVLGISMEKNVPSYVSDTPQERQHKFT